MKIEDVFEYYKGLPHQQKAIAYMWHCLSEEQQHNFTTIWRTPLQPKKSIPPFFSQLDNQVDPYGACWATSMAMCLAWGGIKGDGQGQLEDQIYREFVKTGLQVGSPYDMANTINSMGRIYGIKDDFQPDAKFTDIIEHVSGSGIGIIHGMFTRSGHVIVIYDFDKNYDAFVVHDPYGELNSKGYNTNKSGESLKYSRQTMQKLCYFPGNSSGSCWFHFISKV